MKYIPRQTQRERQQIKAELSAAFNNWNQMTDQQLMVEAQRRYPALSGVPNRGQLLKFLVMDTLDRIN